MTSEPIRDPRAGHLLTPQVGCELQRDWARQETAEGFTQILFGGDRPWPGLAASPPATELVRAGEMVRLAP
jgi:hypothetical protein